MGRQIESVPASVMNALRFHLQLGEAEGPRDRTPFRSEITKSCYKGPWIRDNPLAGRLRLNPSPHVDRSLFGVECGGPRATGLGQTDGLGVAFKRVNAQARLALEGTVGKQQIHGLRIACRIERHRRMQHLA